MGRRLLNTVNSSEYKNVLTALNSDMLSLTPITLEANNSIRFEGSVADMNAGSYQYLFGALGANFLGIQNGFIRLKLPGSGGNRSLTTPLSGEFFTLEVSRDGSENYYTSLNDETPVFLKNYGGSEFDIGTIGFLSPSTYSGISVHKFRINDEVFTPTGNGLTYVGTEGSVITIGTGHSGGENYVNNYIVNKI